MLSLVFIYMVMVVAAAVNDEQPNIIVIVADDLGWNDVSFHGSDQIPTPNIDRLAHEGIILNNYYVQQMCTPTRAALLTGRYPIHTGLQSGVIADAQPYGLGLDEKILPQYLNELGYVSHAVGKWHLGFFAKEYTPTYRGFHSHFGILLGVGDYWDHTCQGAHGGEWGLDFRDNMEVAKNYFGQYSTDVYTNKTVNIIRNHNTTQPLFVYLAHQAIHRGNYADPLQGQDKYFQRLAHIKDHDRRMVGAMVTNMDESVGAVVSALKARGMLENTIIVFTSDNGGPTAHFDDNMANNWPLRGMKDTLWEGGIRVPAFIWSQRLNRRSRVSHQHMHVTDWLPTILHAAGATTVNATHALDGHDQWRALSDDIPSPRRETLINIDDAGTPNFAIRVGDFKLVSPNWYTRPRFGWYPPPGWNDSDTTMRFSAEPNFHDFKPIKRRYIDEYKHNPKYRNHTLTQITRKLAQYSSKYSRKEHPVVDCGPRTPDADFNCRPGLPCVYHIPSDPCEFTNIYDQEPEVVTLLYERMLVYKRNRVAPRNRPEDPRGFPIHNNFVWGPWIDLSNQ